MKNVSEETVKELVDVLENIIIFGLSSDYEERAQAVIDLVRGEDE